MAAATPMRIPIRLLFLVLLALVGGCSNCGKQQPGDGGGDAPAKPQPRVAAPKGLLFELTLSQPSRLWSDLRTATGGPAVFLPRTIGGLVTNGVGMSIRMAQEIDERLPIVAAGVERAGSIDVSMAVHVKNRLRFVALLKQSKPVRFEAQQKGELTWLKPTKNNETQLPGLQLALFDNYLVLANGSQAIERLAPFLARNMARRKAPGEALRGHITAAAMNALDGLLRASLPRLLEQIPPELAPLLDAKDAATTVTRLAKQLAGGDFTLAVADDALRLNVTMQVANATAKAELAALAQHTPADALRLPDDSMVALAWTDTAARRSATTKARIDSIIKLMNPDATQPKAGNTAAPLRDRVHEILLAIAKGRGDHTLVGARCTGVGVTGFAKGSVSNAKGLRAGLASLVALKDHPIAKQKLSRQHLKVTTKKGRLERVPHDLMLIRVTHDPPKAQPGRREPIDFRYAIGDERFFAAAGMETVDTVKWLFEPPDQERTLARHATLKTAFAAMSKRAWLSVMIDPQSLVACRAGMPGGKLRLPLVLSLGMDGDRIVVRSWLAKPLLKLLARLR